jgi:hypothetical protein
MAGRRSIAIVATAAAVLGLGVLAVAAKPPWSFTKSVEQDRGVYYRLKVKLTYKGEPQDFDIVVGCNVLQINYKDNSRTREVGLVPSVFGRRMSDGKGLVVKALDACNGETTANGRVPPDLLPAIVVYDDAETLAFGTAYFSDDAYESPLSVLTFGGATIERASRAEFEAFRREQPNLVKPETYHVRSGFPPPGLALAAVPFGGSCYGYARFRLVGEALERVRALWPAEKPRYWVPTRWQDVSDINGPVYDRPMRTDHEGAPVRPRYELVPWLDYEIAARRMPRRRPVKDGIVFPPSYYPDIGAWVSLPWPSDPAAAAQAILADGPRIGASIDFRGGATRGFAYCYSHPAAFPINAKPPVTDPSHPPLLYMKKPASDRVDGIEVVQVPPDPRGHILMGPPLIVERDEFIFQSFNIGLYSTRGGV